MSKIHACSTMQQFIKEWDRKLDHIITSFGLADLVEDIKQDIYEQMVTIRPETGKTGLESYDPAQGSFSTYVYALVTTKARNARAKRQRELGVITHIAKSSEEDDDGLANWSRDLMEAHSLDITGARTEKERVEFIIQLGDIDDILRTYPSRSDFFQPNGELVVRDLQTLFQLILQGRTREEIVGYFQYSTGSVGVMFEALRKVPELQELRDMVYGSAG